MSTKRYIPIRRSLSSVIRWYPLLCYNMLKYMNYKHFFIFRIQKNEMSYKSAIFYIKLKFSIPVHLDGLYNLYSVFFSTNRRLKKKIRKLEICRKVFFFFKILKIRESSSVGLSIIRHFEQRN